MYNRKLLKSTVQSEGGVCTLLRGQPGMPKDKTQQSLFKPLIWEIHDDIPTPVGVDREGVLSMYRLKYGCLQFIRDKKSKPSWTPEDEYIKSIVEEVGRRWKKLRDPYNVIRLLDNFPRLLEPSIIPDFPWVLEALEAIFISRKYSLFSDLNAALKARGSHKSDVNIKTFRHFHSVFRYLRQGRILDWVHRSHPDLGKMIDEGDMGRAENYIRKHNLIQIPENILRGLWTEARDTVCRFDHISKETFTMRMKRAPKEAAVKELIRTTSILGDDDMVLVIPLSPRSMKPARGRKQKAGSNSKESA